MTASISLDYLVLRCSDLERSRAFYEALGLTPVAERHDAGPLHFACVLGEFVLELYPASERFSSNVRIGLRVANFEACVAAARGAGAEDVRVVEEAVPRFALVRDPDGNQVALSEYAFVAEFEDDVPGGFNNPDGSSTPSYVRVLGRVVRGVVVLLVLVALVALASASNRWSWERGASPALLLFD